MIRCKSVDWQTYLTTRFVDDFASHLRLFRKAQEAVSVLKVSKNQNWVIVCANVKIAVILYQAHKSLEQDEVSSTSSTSTNSQSKSEDTMV